ncbi:hypothetical protein QUB56_32930 [Microcoleus sp. AR_TQ3_B6]|uniref:hypothetical protein n=1 Tax=Microcoleus sp. AR_TQ3_B6 TaxID=3055284 RepID=UPI002FD2EF45
MLIGAAPETNRISAFWRILDRAMGLFSTPSRLYLSSKYQLWQLDNVLSCYAFKLNAKTGSGAPSTIIVEKLTVKLDAQQLSSVRATSR